MYPLRNILQRRLVPPARLRKRRPRLHLDIALVTPRFDVFAWQPRIHFDLVDAQHASLALTQLGVCVGDVFLEFLQMLVGVRSCSLYFSLSLFISYSKGYICLPGYHSSTLQCCECVLLRLLQREHATPRDGPLFRRRGRG